jgi:glycosyltransferase involved in cell wall biosynthesis
MNLTVLNVAYPFAPVGPDSVGGAEQVLAQLDAALLRAGHESLVLAGRGSQAQGVQFTFSLPCGDWSPEARSSAQRRYRAAISEITRRWRVDVIHMHGLDFWTYLPAPGPPVLATLHLPPSFYPESVFTTPRPQTFLNCVSRTQKECCPSSSCIVRTIENGVDLEALTPQPQKENFVLAMGRICPEKGFHHAITAAKMADVPLVLAGHVFPYPDHQRYFESEIAPRLSAKCRFIGQADFENKRRLLAASRCVLIPSAVAETSSLVAMEALACGTPVVAYPTGALPEIVEHGRTGFIVEDEREMAEAIKEVKRLNPRDCRDSAERRFDIRSTCRAYLELYDSMAAGRIHTEESSQTMPWRDEITEPVKACSTLAR